MTTNCHGQASIMIARRLEENHASGFSCFSEAVKAADGILDALDQIGLTISPMQSCAGLTPAQAQLLSIIHTFATENGYAPSFEEMRSEMGLKTKSSVHRLVVGLKERGALRHCRRGANRSLSITTAGTRYLEQQKGTSE